MLISHGAAVVVAVGFFSSLSLHPFVDPLHGFPATAGQVALERRETCFIIGVKGGDGVVGGGGKAVGTPFDTGAIFVASEGDAPKEEEALVDGDDDGGGGTKEEDVQGGAG